MPQTSYSQLPAPGTPGMIYDAQAIGGGDIVSFTAGVVIPFGVLCELTPTGLLQPVQETNANWPPLAGTATNAIAGVSVYDPLGVEMAYLGFQVPPSITGSSTPGYPKGAKVPVMRRGRVWMAYDGLGGANATNVRLGAANVWHSSDATHPQGVITFTATATTAGAEVSNCPASMEVFDPGNKKGQYTTGFGTVYGVIPMSINLPGVVS